MGRLGHHINTFLFQLDSKLGDIAHAHAVVLMASRRVENVGLALKIITTNRRYH